MKKKSKPKTQKYYLLTLGCPKNTVDSEGMSELLLGANFRATDNPKHADVLLVNTCGFLQAAKDESIGALQDLAAHKKRGQLLIAAGCMAQRFGNQIANEVQGLDGVIGTRSWADIVSFIQSLRDTRRARKDPIYHLPETGDSPIESISLNRNTQPGRASAYLKISDGCSAPCAFCTIPSFKGANKSRPRELILQEAQRLTDTGVKEIIVIGQDTTAYGRDLGQLDGLPSLLEDLAKTVPDSTWLRLMYAYPGHASDKLLDVMAAHSQILPYIDMPLQHGHPDTLRRMNRPHNVEKLLRWIENFRAMMPGATFRTTFIVGYPGETDTEFDGLLDFIKAARFDRLGAFTFSAEPGTPAFDLPNQIDEAIKSERWERLMALQQPISLAQNQAMVGETVEVIVDGVGEGVSICRSYRDAPEVDGYVIIEEELSPGDSLPAIITGAMEYDLLAIPANKPIIVG